MAVAWLASTYLVLKMFRPLFSIAPMLKSLMATIMKRSRSSARPKRASSQAIDGHEPAHRVLGLVQGRRRADLQQVLRCHCALMICCSRRTRLAADQGEQVARLCDAGPPTRRSGGHRPVAAFHQVAVGQQHRVLRLVGPQQHAVAGHHVGAVQEVGDAAKAFGLRTG